MRMSFVWYVSGIPSQYQSKYSPSPASRNVSPINATQSVPGPGEHFEALLGKHAPQTKAYIQSQKQVPERRQVILARDIMTSPVITLDPSSSIDQAWAIFMEKRFRHIPTVDHQGRLIGIISDRDLLRATSGLIQKQSLQTNSIKEIVKNSVLSATPDTEIRTIARIFFEEHIGSMPISDSEGRVVGIITRSDILRAFMNNVPLELWL